MKYNIITISREYGSGGKEIGQMLGKKLGIPCYNSEIIDKVAEQSGFAREYVKDKGEFTSSGHLSALFKNNYYYRSSNEDIIWSIQTKIIKELAEQGPCIIIGRCADYIFSDRDDVLRVFISANFDARVDRIVNIYGKEEPPEKIIKDRDKHRAAYYQYYTDMKWGESRNYDICLSSSSLGFEKCAEILCDICTST